MFFFYLAALCSEFCAFLRNVNKGANTCTWPEVQHAARAKGQQQASNKLARLPSAKELDDNLVSAGQVSYGLTWRAGRRNNLMNFLSSSSSSSSNRIS